MEREAGDDQHHFVRGGGDPLVDEADEVPERPCAGVEVVQAASLALAAVVMTA